MDLRGQLLIILFAICARAELISCSSDNCSLSNHFRRNIKVEPDFCIKIPKNITTSINTNHKQKQFKFVTVTKKQFEDVIYSTENLEDVDRVYFTSVVDEESVSKAIQLGLTAKVQAITYSDMLIHHYDRINERIVAGGPQVNQEQCLQQLQEMNIKASKLTYDKMNSSEWGFYQLMNTFGWQSSGISGGNILEVGSYVECLRLHIQSESRGKLATRYCLASVKHTRWSNGTVEKPLSLKMAVCLPKSCDSMNYKSKYELINSLISFNRREMDKEEQYVSDLYCLPDEQSALRAWWRQPKSMLFLTAFFAWLALLIYATLKSEEVRSKVQRRRKQLLENNKSRQEKNQAEETSQAVCIITVEEEKILATYRSLSITHNFRNLCGWYEKSPKNCESRLNADDQQQPAATCSNGSKKEQVVDLQVLDGIKVICTLYITFAHVLMCLVLLVKNGRDFASTSSPAYILSHSIPAFAVNSFFTITGLLTSYMIFKQNCTHSFITSPAKWTALIIYRYLRIMPTYLFVVLYGKLVAKYTGSGPFWDYATSGLAHRRICEQESILWTLLFGANFKSPFEHCIASAWYLANDFQFFLVTPLFMYILYKNERFGTQLLKACAAMGTIAGFVAIYRSDLLDMRPIANFKPHGFKLYYTFLSYNYAQPQYRIPSYLLGLLFGFCLHRYEQDKQRNLESQKDLREKESNLEERPKEDCNNSVKPEWSDHFIKHGTTWSVSIVVVCLLLPVIAMQLPFNKALARIAVALFMPGFHVLFSVSVGMYTLLASTGYGSKLLNRFLSARFWKPYAKLSLCCLLVNLEVIMYLTQTKTDVQHIDNQYLTSVGMYCIITVYFVSALTYLLVEAPIKSALSQLVSLLRASSATEKAH